MVSTLSTELAVAPYTDTIRDAWDAYVERHPSGTLFHLTAWKRVIERCFGFEAHYLVAEDSGGIRGVLPLFRVSNLLQGRSLISTPYAVYGGPCADDTRVAAALCDKARRMAVQERAQYLELRVQQPIDDSRLLTKELYVTFDLELPASSEQLLRGFPRDTRYMIRKAQKNGLRATVDNRELATFHEIYSRSFHYLGTPVFSRRFFDIILEEFGDQCELMTVWREQQALASVLSFRFRNGIFPYFGGSLFESRQFAANNFMYWEVMKRALEMGIRFFDFGRSKLGSGSYAFKTQWNMRERPLPYQFALVKRKSLPNFSPANRKFKLAISLWKSMPFALTKVLGPSVVQLFP